MSATKVKHYRRRQARAARRVAVLNVHEMDTCDCGDVYGCSHPPYCVASGETDEPHGLDIPDWPCGDVLRVYGFATADAFWHWRDAEDLRHWEAYAHREGWFV